MNRKEREAYLKKQNQEYRAKVKELADERARLEALAEARKARISDLEQEQRNLAALAVDAGDMGRPVLVVRYGSAASELSLIPAELKVISERIDLLTDQLRALQDSRSFVRRREDA